MGWFLHWFYWTSALSLTQAITGTNGSVPGWLTLDWSHRFWFGPPQNAFSPDISVSYGVPHGFVRGPIRLALCITPSVGVMQHDGMDSFE